MPTKVTSINSAHTCLECGQAVPVRGRSGGGKDETPLWKLELSMDDVLKGIYILYCPYCGEKLAKP